jgi:hypothetical protein
MCTPEPVLHVHLPRAWAWVSMSRASTQVWTSTRASTVDWHVGMNVGEDESEEVVSEGKLAGQ